MQDRNAFDPTKRGYHAVYREGDTNHCPGCGRTHWHIGRTTAECAFCGTALPLEADNRRSGEGAEVIRHGRTRPLRMAWA
jgi:hypothetical protein